MMNKSKIKLSDALNELSAAEVSERIDAANKRVAEHMKNSEPYLIGMKRVRDCVPQIKALTDDGAKLVFHAGPEIAWSDMCETQRMGGINGCLFEGYARDAAEARQLLESGEVNFASGNDYHIVCSGSGITTPSMCVNIVEDKSSGVLGFCAPFECRNRGGLGGWGVYNSEIGSYLHTISDVIAPTLCSILDGCGGLPLKEIFAQGFVMGDELHSRQEAVCTVGKAKIMELIYSRSDLDSHGRDLLADMLYHTVRYFHPIGMSYAMSVLEGVRLAEASSIVTAMEGNGVTYGIKVAGLGNEWFTAASPKIKGECKNEDDVLPWIGDSSMMECVGFGGFAAAASPTVMRSMGKSMEDGILQSESMYGITVLENTDYEIPSLGFRGVPEGIDVLKVVKSGICPVIHGGMMSKSGIRLGGGSTHVPLECFEKAAVALAERYGNNV